jgi:hypothetical protein
MVAGMSAPSFAHEFGLNLHTGAGSSIDNQRISEIMRIRNIRNARVDSWDLAQTRDVVTKVRAIGGRAEISLQIPFQWDHSCNADHAAVERTAYDQTAAMVHQYKDLITDFEMLNEVTLRPEISREVAPGAGTTAKAYAEKPCAASLVAALRGMSRAIKDIRNASGLPLRAILGAVNRDFGFLDFAQQNGVAWDVTGWHIYPWNHNASLLTDAWFGSGGPLAQLAQRGKPVRINEFNCGETYGANYENRTGAAATETCLRSLAKHLKHLRGQRIVDLESVHIYELLDEPAKPAPENRFGVMYDLSRPKVHLYLVTAFAGGTLSAAERSEITTRGLLTDSEIDAMRVVPAPAAAPANPGRN